MTAPAPTRESIRRLTGLIQRELDELYRSSAPLGPSSPLNQAGLTDGAQIVDDYLDHNELGLAFEHLIYMLVESGIDVTQAQFDEIATIGGDLGLPPSIWHGVSVHGEV